MGNKTECLEEVLLENRADVDSVEPDGSVLRVAVSLGRESFLMEVKPRDMENFVECNTEAKNSLQSLKDTELPDFDDKKPWHNDVAYYLRNASSVGSI
ncbi:hypothetical protein F4823DRAFT_557393 [Ustulina deusta]|nr:hypothetical protein F4823DRAFT_557393 [Ustulina deusta]